MALYSSDHFRKSFCQFEIRKAMVRDIATPDTDCVLLPFRLDPDAHPPLFATVPTRGPAGAIIR